MTVIEIIEAVSAVPQSGRKLQARRIEIVPIDRIGTVFDTRHYDTRHDSGTSTSIMRFEEVTRPDPTNTKRR